MRRSVFVNQPGSLENEFTEDEACRNSGQYGLRLTFDFSGNGNGGWGVSWDKAPDRHFDVSQFTELTFSVKGDAPNGFQVGVKDTSENEVKVEVTNYVVVSQSQWRPIVIPLSGFANGEPNVDLANVRNVNFGFNQNHDSGNVCIDEIAFR